MDARKLTELLRATINPTKDLRNPAEEQLLQIHKIIGFVPTLLQIVMQNDMDPAVRQAGVIYLKNFITQNWQDREQKAGTPLIFSIHEQDRAMIRDGIIDAVVMSPQNIRVQLAMCVNVMVKFDFPGRWTQIVDKISIYLQNPDYNGWSGALLCLHYLVKNYEFKESNERIPLNEAMNLLLPMMNQIMINLMPDPSDQSAAIQKQVLKTYHALTQFCLPLDLITREMFAQWMEICRQVIDRVPPDLSHIDEDDRPDLPWWKAKKWAIHIITRMFERYGSPGNVDVKYQKFAEWYLTTFTSGILEVLLKILDQYRNKIYVSPRVLAEVLNYLKTAVSHAYSWKLIKPHIFAVIQDIIFPIMSYNDSDQELWESDPYEYIRMKFDVFEDGATPVPAAQVLFHTCTKKRKGILPKTMHFIMQIITTPNVDAKQKDGAFHLIGTLSDVLLKKKLYRDQMEQMLTTYVFPEFSSAHGHMRARACWVLHSFCDIKFKNPQVLAEILRLATHALLNDKELPVKVEAAIVLQMYLTSQETAPQHVEAQIKPITLELLKVIRETENEDLTNVLQRIVRIFSDQLLPIAIEICQHLATTFSQVLEADESTDEKAITAMGLLNTIETLLTVMEDHPQILVNLHPIVIQLIGHIFQNSIMEFYEESFSLVYDLTSKAITPDMWQMFELIYQVFKKDGFDYFIDMMPALHNYVTVDTQAFLSNPNYILATFTMCKAILVGDAGEDPESHAAKLIEVIILQCKGQIDPYIELFVELVLGRLTQEVKSSELRTMCLQVVIASIYYNPQLLLQVFETMQSRLQQPQTEPISSHFIKQWILDTDCFLGIHDRKLYVLGLCTLLTMGEHKPMVLNELADKILPSLMLIFEGLKRAYHARAQESEEEDSDEDDDEDCEEALSSDDDDVDEYGTNYLDQVHMMVTNKAAEIGLKMNAEIKDGDGEDGNSGDDDDDDDDADDELDETALETYTTPIDDEECDDPINEYVTFHQVMSSLVNQDPSFYGQITSVLSPEQTKALQEIMVLAQQKQAQIQSKKIEKQGGFSFTQQTVPTSFNFGSS